MAINVNYPWEEKPVDAVFFTRYHRDHIRRIMEIPDHIPLYMGETAREVMMNIQEALAHIKDEKEAAKHVAELKLLNNSTICTFK